VTDSEGCSELVFFHEEGLTNINEKMKKICINTLSWYNRRALHIIFSGTWRTVMFLIIFSLFS